MEDAGSRKVLSGTYRIGLGGGGGRGGGGGGGGGTEFSDWFTRFWSSSTVQGASVQRELSDHYALFMQVTEKHSLSPT